MTGSGRVPLFADDSALPDEEREMLDLAGALVPLLADRAPAAAAARQLSTAAAVVFTTSRGATVTEKTPLGRWNDQRSGTGVTAVHATTLWFPRSRGVWASGCRR